MGFFVLDVMVFNIVKFNCPFAAKLFFQELTAMGQKLEFKVKNE